MKRSIDGRRSMGGNARQGVVVAVAAAMLLLAACSTSKAANGSATTSTSASGSSSTGSSLLGPIARATGSPIQIGLISDGIDGVNDASIEGRVAAATAKYLNERRNGIDGHVVNIVECDEQGDPAKGTDCGNQMVQQKVAAVLVNQASVTENAWVPVHAAHIPMMIYSTQNAAIEADTQSTFLLADPIASAIRVPIAVAQQVHTKKVAAVVIDVPQATDLYRVAAPPLFKQAGVQLQVIPVPLGTPDVTPQVQALASNGTGEVFVVGNDALCISIFNGLRAVGYTGKIAAITQCITNATLKAVPASQLKGMVISAPAPMGVNDPSLDLYNAVAKTYGSNIDLTSVVGVGMFTTMMALADSVQNAKEPLTPANIISAIKSAPKLTLQASGGLTFQCNGKADPASPAVCSAGVLTATLDDKGNPVSYKASQPATG